MKTRRKNSCLLNTERFLCSHNLQFVHICEDFTLQFSIIPFDILGELEHNNNIINMRGAIMLETTRIEFKREYNDKVNKVLLSFLNTEGGMLYIGIENDSEKFIESLSLEQNLTFDYAMKVFEDKGVQFGDTQRQSLGLIRVDGRYSNLALLLSDQCPYSIKAAIFQGTTKAQFKDRKEFTGSAFKQIDEVLAYLNVYNKVASTFEGVYRIDHPDYPDVVLREAVLNAVIHRDYYIEGAILVSMFDDRIEIMSLGGILPGVTKEIMLSGVSVPRNEKLAAVFHRLKFIEAYGTGIPRIFEAYAEYKTEPDIPITNSAFLISMPNLSVSVKADKSTSKLKISKNEMRILDEFSGQTFTKQNAADLLELSVSGAYKLLARMVERGLLSCKRNGREMYYVICL